ncbi:MAG: ABC transporter permease subunit [Acidihalobacter sp.]|uniref:ABC transporter permease subunit n=1 Tax=Acidihalobacter sp. TaxID=1872108 RepID=UPI00307E5A49
MPMPNQTVNEQRTGLGQPGTAELRDFSERLQQDVQGRSLWVDARRRFFRNKAAMAAVVILAVIVVAVLIGPLFSPYGFTDTDWGAIFHPPSLANGHIFGTDDLGRDVFVRTMMGGRITLLIGLISSLVSIVIGVAYGSVAGFFGGRVDGFMMRIVDILYSMPFLFFVILLMTFFGRNFILLFVAIGAITWLDMSRIVRGQTLTLKSKEFIEAAYACGVGKPTIIRRHVVPNLLGVVVIYATLTVPTVILTSAFLSFLGLGVQEPMTSWGVLVNDGASNMGTAWWTLVFPAGMLTSTLYCFNFIGDGLRDALDPKDR